MVQILKFWFNFDRRIVPAKIVHSMITRYLPLALFFLCTGLGAQDLHFSQFYDNPMNLNPAATGIFKGDIRAAAIYRSQWVSVPVSYRTFSGAFDWKVLKKENNLVSVGLLLQHDKAGDGGLTWTQAGFSGSVAHALGKSQAISAGFGLAFAQRAVDLSGLKFLNQWTGDLYDPGLPANEPLGRSSGLHPTFSAGLNWHYELEGSRNRLNVGAGMLHLNHPAISFADSRNFRLPTRVTFTLDGALEAGQSTDVVGFGVMQKMLTAQEIIVGGGVHQILSSGPGQDIAVQLTLALRLGDALIPAVQLEYNNWLVGVSYDYNTSPFDVATRGRGGIEVAVIYRNLPAPPVKTFKSCPIF
jgi:type IX secretion system PorP/SprF family membrane protein